MTDETRTFELTRRNVLAGIGGVGLASAAAGLGTSAYLNDTESFEDNSITAGTLDLKVDWEEHYYDGSSGSGMVSFSDPGDGAVGFPDPENPQVWLTEDDIPEFMDATSIEAFPDPNNDGVQEMSYEDFEYAPCDHGADLPKHLDPKAEGALRTDNETTWDEEAEEWRPLIDLQDVKPGDFGEFTLSFHLCDNPGYVWLQAANVSESENGINDPEAEVDETPEDPELAENIQTAWWYDTDGNNVIDETVGKVDVMIAVDTSASLDDEQVGQLEDAANDLASQLDSQADARVGGLSFADTVDNFTGLDAGPVNFSGLTAGGGTMMPGALDIAAAELDAEGRPDAESFVVLFTDGGPNYNPTDNHSAGGYTVGPYPDGNTNWNTVTDGELDETADVADGVRSNHRILAVGIADDRPPEGRTESGAGLLSTYLRDEIAGSAGDYFSAEDPGAVSGVLSAIIDAIAVPEEVFHRGTLADDLDALASGDGIPLDGSLATEFDELDDDPADDDRECFQPGVNYFVGFAWWLPTEVGNEIQGDSVSFDLGFYAEQCRHNDGSGTVAET